MSIVAGGEDWEEWGTLYEVLRERLIIYAHYTISEIFTGRCSSIDIFAA
jgi:hypothetical protein